MPPRTTPQRAPAPEWLVWAALLVIYLVWGSTYLAIRVVVDTMPPLLAAAGRFGTAGVIMAIPLVLHGGLARLRVTRTELAGSAFVAATLLLVGNGFVSLGEREVPSALAALIIGVVPLIVLIFRAVTGERITRIGAAGVLLGFAGLGVLVIPRGIDGTVAVGGMLMLIVASASWALGSFYSRRLTLPSDPLVSTTFQLVLGGLFLLVAGSLIGELGRLRVEDFSTASVVSFVYLVVFGSVLAYTAYTWLLQNAPISKVATYAYVNPVVAVALGWLILQEEVNASMLLGAAMIVAAVAFIVWTESRASREPPRATVEAPPVPSSGTASAGGSALGGAVTGAGVERGGRPR
jgi:drug/metabolite transporter (DMT)-like permease